MRTFSRCDQISIGVTNFAMGKKYRPTATVTPGLTG
jgi:hypothetical protein